MDVSGHGERLDDLRDRALREFAARAENLPGLEACDLAAVELIDRLERSGVDVLLLKGPALASLLYRPGEHRGYYDVDVLVDAPALASARDTLAQLGYENRSALAGIDNFLGTVHGETWVRSRDAAVDLHWQLAGCSAAATQTWRMLYAGRGTIAIRGREVSVPGRDGLALHLALHVADHGPNGIKALGDLARGLERWPLEVWLAAAGLADALQATPAFAAGLRLLPQGALVADRLGLGPTPELTWTILHRDARPRGTFHVRALADADGWRARAGILRRSMFPRRAWIQRQFPWARRGGWMAITGGYAAHLACAPLWAARAWWFLHSARRGDGRRNER